MPLTHNGYVYLLCALIQLGVSQHQETAVGCNSVCRKTTSDGHNQFSRCTVDPFIAVGNSIPSQYRTINLPTWILNQVPPWSGHLRVPAGHLKLVFVTHCATWHRGGDVHLGRGCVGRKLHHCVRSMHCIVHMYVHKSRQTYRHYLSYRFNNTLHITILESGCYHKLSYKLEDCGGEPERACTLPKASINSVLCNRGNIKRKCFQVTTWLLICLYRDSSSLVMSASKVHASLRKWPHTKKVAANKGLPAQSAKAFIQGHHVTLAVGGGRNEFVSNRVGPQNSRMFHTSWKQIW